MEPYGYGYRNFYATYYHNGPNNGINANDTGRHHNELMKHVVFDMHNYSVVSESVLMDNIPIIDCDGQISLAYESLPCVPKSLAEKFASTTHTLDLSHNDIKELGFLSNFEKLTTLILDRNEELNIKSMPKTSKLEILWLNNCNITQLSEWINHIRNCCPKLRQLSLLGNPGIQSTFNGASILEHNDYRMYVISQIPTLQYLDDSMVTEMQRAKACENSIVFINGMDPLTFINRFGYDIRKQSSFRYDNGKRFVDVLSSDSSENTQYI